MSTKGTLTTITEENLTQEFVSHKFKTRRLRSHGTATTWASNFALEFCLELFPRDPLRSDVILDVPSTEGVAEGLCAELRKFNDSVCSCVNQNLAYTYESTISGLADWDGPNYTRSSPRFKLSFAAKPTWYQDASAVRWTVAVQVNDDPAPDFVIVEAP